MEVHKPRLVANWRELLKEWGIIVLGVLTALLAEQAVQSIEWRHKVHAAVVDMKQELSVADGPQSYTRLAMHECVDKRLAAIQQAVDQGDRQTSRRLIDTLWLPRRTYDSLAREDAVASDVASHMSAEEMFNFRIVYELIPELNRLQDKELTDLAQLRALPASGGELQQSEKLSELHAIANLQLDNARMARAASFTLRHMRDVAVGLERDSMRRNLGEANQHYRGCLKADLRSDIAGGEFDPW